MNTLPLDRDAYPPGMELKGRTCEGCGEAGYVPAHIQRRPPKRCRDCERGEWKRRLDPDVDTRMDRREALIRVHRMGLLPMEDPADDATHIAKVVTRSDPTGGTLIKRKVRVVERECPACGHDRADETVWRVYTCERGESIECRLCDHVIESHSTL